MDKEKLCTKCGIVKPPSEFYKDKTKKSGLHSHCKSCKVQTYNYEKGSYDKEKYQIRYHNIKIARAKIDELEKENDILRLDAQANLKKYLVERNKVAELEKRLK